MRRKKPITLLRVNDIKSASITIDIEDDLYEAMAEAGRVHIVKDKLACFSYAVNQALLELCKQTK